VKTIFEGVVLSAFDPSEGPYVIHTSMNDRSIATKIAVRSYIALGLSQTSFDITELMLPVFDELGVQTHFAFSMLFHCKYSEVDKKTEANIASLSWVFPAGQEMNFYTIITELRNSGQKIISEIRKNPQLLRTNPIELIPFVETEIVDCESNIQNISSSSLTKRSQQLIISNPGLLDLDSQSSKFRDLSFLKAIPKKDLFELLQAALLGEPILILSDEYTFNKIANTLYLFHFRGVSRKAYLRKQALPPYDNNVVGSSTSLETPKNIQEQYKLTYSFGERKFKSKKRFKVFNFTKTLASNILLATSLEEVLENHRLYLEDKNLYVSLILDALAKTKDAERESIDETKKLILDLRKLMIKDDYEFVIEVAIQTNPVLESFIRKEL
jgi:hypothetical protein